MQFRKWNLDTDYLYLIKWWNQYNFGIVPKECLPPDGIIVEDNNKPICAGGLYRCIGTKFGFMEWIIVDKTINLKLAHKSLNLCISKIIEFAKNNNIKLLFTVTAATALHKRYVKYHEMKIAENNVKTFIKDLDSNYNNFDWVLE